MDPTPAFADVDVSTFVPLDREQMGTKPKQWLEDASGRWLFKWMSDAPGRRHRGEDWAEKLAAEIGAAVGLPCARVELAHRGQTIGVIVREVRPNDETDLVHGNELLASRLAGYPRQRRRNIAQYRIDEVVELLDFFETDSVLSPHEQFGCYLAFDALIGNTDRHHENWAAMVSGRGARRPVLAPSFDHGTSLGCGITDVERMRRLGSADSGYVPSAYGRQAKSHFDDAGTLIDAAVRFVALRPVAVGAMRAMVSRADPVIVEKIVARVPPSRMSMPAKHFSVAMVEGNRSALLTSLEDLR